LILQQKKMHFENLQYKALYDVIENCLEFSASAILGKSETIFNSSVLRKELRVTLLPDSLTKSITINATFSSYYNDEGYLNVWPNGDWLTFDGKDKKDFIGKSLVIELCNIDDKMVEYKAEIMLSSNEIMNGETRSLQLIEPSISNQKILCKELDSLKTSLDKIGDVSKFVSTERLKILDRQKQEKRELEDRQEQEKGELEDRQKEEKGDLEDTHELELETFDDQTKEIYKKMRSFTESSLQLPECPVCLEEMRPPVQIFNCLNGHVICGKCRRRVFICTHCRRSYKGRATAMELWIKGIV